MESIVGPIPNWLEPVGLPDWPLRDWESAKLRYSTRIPEPWAAPEEKALPTHLEELFRGASPREGLLVRFAEGADLHGWAEAPAVTAALAAAGDPPQTLDWHAAEAPDSLNDRFRVEEVHLFEGLVRASDGSLSRVYTLLARRGALAWHVGLALATENPPGAPPDVVERTDHRRAGGTMGELRFT